MEFLKKIFRLMISEDKIKGLMKINPFFDTTLPKSRFGSQTTSGEDQAVLLLRMSPNRLHCVFC